MPRLSRAIALLVFVLCAGLAHAQVRTVATRGLEKKVPSIQLPGRGGQVAVESDVQETPVPTISGLGTTITQEQARAMTIGPDDEFTKALRAVAKFLQLRPDQVEDLIELLQLRREAVVPLLQQIADRERQIRDLLASGGDPAAVGQLVIEIHQFYELIQRAQGDFMAGFQALLEDNQRQRLEAVRLALRLQPILPAFRALHLL